VVTEKLCTHDFKSWHLDFLFGPLTILTEWTHVRLRECDGDVPMEMRGIRVSLANSVDWVLERDSAFLVPQDIKTRNRMKQLGE
jgi:hypothetical protein